MSETLENVKHLSDKATTSKEFIDKFDHFTRATHNGNVIIHPNLPFSHIELTGKFVDELKNDLAIRIMMAHSGIDSLSPIERFAIMILSDSY